MSVEPAGIEDEELIEGKKEITQLEELVRFLNDAAMDIQGIATNQVQYLDYYKNKFKEQLALLSPRNNLLYDISQIKRSFIVLENVLYPRIKVNPNFKKVSEILKNQGYISRSHSKKDSPDEVDTNAGYCKNMVLIDISSNLYGVVASLELLLEKIKAAEAVSVGITDISIENTAKGIAAAQGFGVYEIYKEPLSEALNEMWRLHGRTEQWQNIAPAWESMNGQLDLIAAGKIYKFSLAHYEAFEEKYDDLHTFEGDKRGFATLRGVLNKVDKFVRNYKVEL